ncbi:DUF4136 domain-containing protein [Veronia nyctiphanis]|nr:DUF4136 domain-containing protein [Veronia nyctiphanis]
MHKRALSLSLMLTLAGCGSMPGFDCNEPFNTKFTSYRLFSHPNTVGSNQITIGVNRIMTSKGYTLQPHSADLLVKPGIRKRVQTTIYLPQSLYSFRNPDRPTKTPFRTNVKVVNEVHVELVDTNKGQTVWRHHADKLTLHDKSKFWTGEDDIAIILTRMLSSLPEEKLAKSVK